MLTLNDVSYIHSNRDALLNNIHLTINKHDKIALIGNNGVGKSTLLKILAGNLQPTAGTIQVDSKPYYLPQHVGQFNDFTIAQVLYIDQKLKALKEIMKGDVTHENMALLNDDWLLEERCNEAFAKWQMQPLDLNRKMISLSGGQKTKIFLSGIDIHQPEIILMDEPSNHLDIPARNALYQYVDTTSNTLVVVSHDRSLLNILNTTHELSKKGIRVYGGNYDFYSEQKSIETNAIQQELKNKEKSLRKAKEVEQESLERKQKRDARGKRKQEKAGLPTISMNTFKNNAEKSTSRLKEVHKEKIEMISHELNQSRAALSGTDKMKMNLGNSLLHRNKKIIEASDVGFSYHSQLLWKQPLTFRINSGERIAIKGSNGSGKTTLLKIILGNIQPSAGVIHRAEISSLYIDQDYSLIDKSLSVYDQAQKFNYAKLPEHELKIRLNRFLFTKDYWDKTCNVLSGGEKMRLMLCCLMISSKAPDLIVLDEPTNNLDIQNIEILTNAMNEYQGTLIIVSHDQHFLEQLKIEKEIVIE